MQIYTTSARFTLCAVAALLPFAPAHAQTFPSKPLRLLVPFAPGGASDIIARAMNEPLNRALGQSVIVENKPGAGSSLAVDQVAKSAPDGYTMVIASQSGIIVNPTSILRTSSNEKVVSNSRSSRPTAQAALWSLV